jgi:hypothetical protein
MQPPLRLNEEEIMRAAASVDAEDREIIAQAAANIRTFHEAQVERSWFMNRPDGTTIDVDSKAFHDRLLNKSGDVTTKECVFAFPQLAPGDIAENVPHRLLDGFFGTGAAFKHLCKLGPIMLGTYLQYATNHTCFL